MPITQDRLIALIETIETLVEAERATLRQMEAIKSEIQILARNGADLESILDLAINATQVPSLYLKANNVNVIRAFIAEQEHFKRARLHNERSRAAMQRLAARRRGEQELQEGKRQIEHDGISENSESSENPETIPVENLSDEQRNALNAHNALPENAPTAPPGMGMFRRKKDNEIFDSTGMLKPGALD